MIRRVFRKALRMPQLDMILLTQREAEGANVIEHKAGAPVHEGGGE